MFFFYLLGKFGIFDIFLACVLRFGNDLFLHSSKLVCIQQKTLISIRSSKCTNLLKAIAQDNFVGLAETFLLVP